MHAVETGRHPSSKQLLGRAPVAPRSRHEGRTARSCVLGCEPECTSSERRSGLKSVYSSLFFRVSLGIFAGCSCCGCLADRADISGQSDGLGARVADAAIEPRVRINEANHFTDSKLSGADPLLLLPGRDAPILVALSEANGAWAVDRIDLATGSFTNGCAFQAPIGDFDMPVAFLLDDLDSDGEPDFVLLSGATLWSRASAAKLRIEVYSGASMQLINRAESFKGVGYGGYGLTLMELELHGRVGNRGVLIIAPHSTQGRMPTQVYEYDFGAMSLVPLGQPLDDWVDGRILGIVSSDRVKGARRVLILSAPDGEGGSLVAKALPSLETLWSIRNHEALAHRASMHALSMDDADGRGVADILLVPTSYLSGNGPEVFCVSGEDGKILWSMCGRAFETLRASAVPDLSGDGLSDFIFQRIGSTRGDPTSSLEVRCGATGESCGSWTPSGSCEDFGSSAFLSAADRDHVWCVAGGTSSGLWLLRIARPRS